jgi:hypothetical protein
MCSGPDGVAFAVFYTKLANRPLQPLMANTPPAHPSYDVPCASSTEPSTTPSTAPASKPLHDRTCLNRKPLKTQGSPAWLLKGNPGGQSYRGVLGL